MTSDTSTFIAATSDMTLGANPLTARRAANAGDKPAIATTQAQQKEIRRDSKGFENFDDYFDSDVNDSTVTQDGDEEEEATAEKSAQNDEAVEQEEEAAAADNDEEATDENAFNTVPAPTETMPEEILDGPNQEEKAAEKAETKKASLADLSKQWDDEEEPSEQQQQQEAPEEEEPQDEPEQQVEWPYLAVYYSLLAVTIVAGFFA